MGADCKSVGLCLPRFESWICHQCDRPRPEDAGRSFACRVTGYRPTMWQKLASLVARNRQARREGEGDAPTDAGEVTTRPVGGGSDAPTQDAHSSTGTTSHETFVGRTGGDESGDVGLSGAEARGDGDLDHQGAARRE